MKQKKMYMVGKLTETKGAHCLVVEVPKGCIGLIPVYSNKKDALKLCNYKYPLFEGFSYQPIKEQPNDR
jgi:hypothetical protein